MRISFDYFDDEYQRGQEWAETLPQRLRDVIAEFAFSFAITSRGIWYTEAGHCWEYMGTRRDMRAYLAEIAGNQ